ncbi:hypothetical protein KY285_036686 [Solanum tuberosum]|nr:hypothetical protein KY285_036686 [Solanum tuberosum]
MATDFAWVSCKIPAGSISYRTHMSASGATSQGLRLFLHLNFQLENTSSLCQALSLASQIISNLTPQVICHWIQ